MKFNKLIFLGVTIMFCQLSQAQNTISTCRRPKSSVDTVNTVHPTITQNKTTEPPKLEHPTVSTTTIANPSELKVQPLEKLEKNSHIQSSSSSIATEPVNLPNIEERVWKITPEDKYYSLAFTRWAEDSGYELLWEAKKDIIIEGSAVIKGSFEDAIREALQSNSENEYPVEAIFHPNKIVRIVKTAPGNHRK